MKTSAHISSQCGDGSVEELKAELVHHDTEDIYAVSQRDPLLVEVAAISQIPIFRLCSGS